MEILQEHPQFIAVNKPTGLLTIPDREGEEVSLRDLLEARFGKVYTVHRLDRDTSGILLFARTEDAHQYLSRQFEGRQVRKWYRGLVHGTPPSSGSLEGPILEHPTRKGHMVVHRKGKASRTDYSVLESFGLISYVEFEIHTGRTHQIRVHTADMGHPILCDPLYGDGQPVFLSAIKPGFKLSKNEEEERPILARLALHAWKLSFTGPDGIDWTLEAPLPKDLKATLQQLRKWKRP